MGTVHKPVHCSNKCTEHIFPLFVLLVCDLYTCCISAKESEYSHVCPRVSSAVKPFYWMYAGHHPCRPPLKYKTNSSSCQVYPVPTDSAALNLREQNKNIISGSNVSQLKRVARGRFCAPDKLWETLGVLVCCPARVPEVVFPPRAWQWLSGWAAIFSILGWTGSSGGLDVTHWQKNQLPNSFSFVFNSSAYSWWRDTWKSSGMTLKFLK